MPSPARTRSLPPLGRFVGYAAAALTIAALFALAWHLREILLLTFGALVIAAIIRAIARPLTSRYPQREKLGVLAAILALFLFVAGVSWLFGHQISAQMRGLGERLPQAIASAREWGEQNAVGRYVLEKVPEPAASHGAKGKTTETTEASEATAATEGGGSGGGLMSAAKKAASITFTSISHALLMLVAGIYFAIDPRLYLRGFSRLFPPAYRERVRDALEASGDTLQRWLLGQLVSMATIGVLTGTGLALVGCPVPVALGILAGLLVFVPVVGFLVAFVPTVLIALSEGTQTALAAIIVFLVVQQLEEQIVQPLAQKWATALPPALGLLALAATGLLFGIPGLIFGAPLTVVIMCLVQKLYLEYGLDEKPTP